MSLRTLLAVAVGALALSALVGEAGTATAGSRACSAVSGSGGYSYAGHQATRRAHGVRATVTLASQPRVEAGHVSGWVGVGGPGQGANGEDAWIQVGVAAMPRLDPFLYAEVTREGRSPQFILLESAVRVGETRDVAVAEVSGRPGWWRVWVDGKPVTQPVLLRGSSGRWAPIATAESWSGGEAACNAFSYRFERVSVAHSRGGSWKPFVSGHRFLDRGYRLHTLSTVQSSRSLTGATRAALPYAFVATS